MFIASYRMLCGDRGAGAFCVSVELDVEGV